MHEIIEFTPLFVGPLIAIGGWEPLASNDSVEGRAMNRRVEMVPTSRVRASKLHEVKILVRDVLFAGSTAELSDDGRTYLDEITAAFKDKQFNKVSFLVTGKGRGDTASARAAAVADYLEERGISSNRIKAAGASGAGNTAEVLPMSGK